MQKIQENTITSLLVNNKKVRSLLYDFLNIDDIVNLSAANKKIQKSIDSDKDMLKKVDFSRYLKKLFKRSRKPKKFVHGKIRCNIYDFNSKYLALDYEWTLMNETEKDNKNQIELVKGVIPYKFLKAFTHRIYYSTQLQKYIVINKVVTDKNLKFFSKALIREEKIEEEIDYYDLLYGDDNLNIENFKNVENGMMMRQTLVHKKMKSMKKIENEKDELKHCKDLENLPNLLKRVTIIMCKGGSFSMGVFEKNKEVTHNSDRRYVCRAKGGGKRQSEKDKDKKIKSMGSQIRRFNEKKHQEGVNSILEKNMDHLQKSDIILMHAPGENEAIMFDEGKALDKFRKDGKILSVGSLVGKKANWSEIKRIYDEITKMYIFDEV